MASKVFVAIPARDEAERIDLCLTALNEQSLLPDHAVLLVNNSSDATEAIARDMAPRLRFPLEVISRDLPPEQANAGYARRLAMEAVAAQAEPGSMLMTTDADATVPPDWVARNLRGLHKGVDIVCGRAIIDPLDAALIPSHLHEDDARECHLIALLDELAWVLDPELHDPPLRHIEASGASLAVSLEAFRRVGGIPAIRSGEDRAFVRALWMIDAKVRHDPTIKVMVSGRIVGRAEGGMADAIRRRMVQQDEFTDEQVEPAIRAFHRYDLRQRARLAWHGSPDSALAGDLALSRNSLMDSLSHQYFGTAWAALEASSLVLKRERVRFIDLPAEIAAAEALLRLMAMPETLAAD